MSIAFSKIPADIRTPLFMVELDGARRNSGQPFARTLIIGNKTNVGAAVAGVPLISQGAQDAKVQAGPGSLLALMTAAYRKADASGEIWYLPVADPAGVAATGSLTFGGNVTAPGLLNLYLAGQRVQVAVAASQTSAATATAVAAAINAVTDLPLTAAVDGAITAKVNLTAKHVGLIGNDIDIRRNYLGNAGGEVDPTGLTVTTVAMASGAGAPDLVSALANIGDQLFDFIVSPYVDTASLSALSAFMDENTGRWSYARKIYGHIFSAKAGNYGALTTFGLAQNDKHNSAMGVYDSPTPSWIWAAVVAGVAAVALRADPGSPVQFLPLPGVLAPPLQSRFDVYERNALLHDGVSTFTVDSDGTCRLESLITFYQKNALGEPDASFLYMDDLFKAAYILRSLESMVSSKYARAKLAVDGTRLNAGSGVVTPNIVRADLIAKYYELEAAGVAQAADTFAANLVVEINAGNPNRLDVLYPSTLMGGLRGFAVLAQFS